MFKRMSPFLLVAAFVLVASFMLFGPGIFMHAATAALSPGDMATSALMASAVLGAPLAEAAAPITMRAKLQVGHIQAHYRTDGTKSQETVNMHAVAASKYPDDGSDEDNTFARWSPGASLSINIANPALFDKFKHGQKFYADFTEAT